MSIVFGPYEVVERVATGSTGTVYRARHTELDRVAAIKELSPAMRAIPGLLERFRGEAEILAGLDHPHVVEVYDYVEETARAWIAEEWVEGASLDAILTTHGRLSPEQSVGVMRGALMGLAHAHDRGLVHRDIAPTNILADLAGTSKLVDFGLAAPVGETNAQGTPAFISPEAARGEPIGKSSDVYSAAAVLYALLAGRPPFPAADPVSTLRRHMMDPPPSLAGYGSDLADLIRRSMDKDASVRPPDAGAFLVELEEAARRRFGAGWLQRASIAGAVASTVAGTATAVGAVSTATVAAAPVIDTGAAAAASTDTAAVATGAARRLGKFSYPTVAGIAAAAIVIVAAVAVGATTLTGDDTTTTDDTANDTAQVTPAASASPSPTRSTPTPTPTPTPPSFADLAPNGTYDTRFTVVASEFDDEVPGTVTEGTWTLVSTCTTTACTGTINSSTGNTFTYTWDGTQLIRSAPPTDVVEDLCIDDVTGEETPGSHFKATTVHAWTPLLSTAPSPTGAPETLTGTVTSELTYSELTEGCTADDTVLTGSYEFTMTNQGTEPTLSATPTGSPSTTPTTSP